MFAKKLLKDEQKHTEIKITLTIKLTAFCLNKKNNRLT